MQKNEVMNDFKRLCEIPHCSCETEQMREFLADFARSQGFSVNIDEAGNIHAVKGEPKICLQSGRGAEFRAHRRGWHTKSEKLDSGR